MLVSLRDESDSGGVGTGSGKIKRNNVAVETVRYLDQNSRSVPGVDVGPLRASVFHIAQRRETGEQDIVTAATTDVAHEADTAGVVFVLRVVQALARGLSAKHLHLLEWFRYRGVKPKT